MWASEGDLYNDIGNHKAHMLSHPDDVLYGASYAIPPLRRAGARCTRHDPAGAAEQKKVATAAATEIEKKRTKLAVRALAQ